MSKVLRGASLLLAALGLAACAAGGGEAASQASAASTTAAGAESGAGEDAPDVVLTDEMALMLGTLKLDEVGLTPDSAQASKLLVLWQAYQSVATSDTAASQEMEAVLKQIRQAMTDEQLAAIAGMDLDSEDLRGLMESFRQEAAAGDSRSAGGFFPGGGQPPAGGGPPGGPGGGFVPQGGPSGGSFGGGGEGLNPEMQATAQAGRTARSGSPSALFLLRPLIADLQGLAGGS